MKRFEKLTHKKKQKILKAQKENKLEVHCEWWPENHWENKLPNTEILDECYYRIKK